MNEHKLIIMRARAKSFIAANLPLLINVMLISYFGLYAWDKGIKYFAVYCLIVFFIQTNILAKNLQGRFIRA